MRRITKIVFVFSVVFIGCSSVPDPASPNHGILAFQFDYDLPRHFASAKYNWVNNPIYADLSIRNLENGKIYHVNGFQRNRFVYIFNIPSGDYEIYICKVRIQYKRELVVKKSTGPFNNSVTEFVNVRELEYLTGDSLASIPHFVIQPNKLLYLGRFKVMFHFASHLAPLENRRINEDSQLVKNTEMLLTLPVSKEREDIEKDIVKKGINKKWEYILPL